MNENLLTRIVDLAVAIQQIPAPTFQEEERISYLLDRFQAEGLCDVSRDAAGNLYARMPGTGSTLPLVVSAHADTVFPVTTDLTCRRLKERVYGPGIGDNALGVAGLFGLLWLLREREVTLPGDLWLVANTGEEGLGNLRGMRAVVERFDGKVLCYLVLEGMALGQIYHRGLGVRRYRIQAHTSGGHSWVDYGKPSAVHELARLVARMTEIALPARPRTTLNVGKISGGTSINTIAAEAVLELDLRSEDPAMLVWLAGSIERLVEQASRPGVQVTCRVIGERPAGGIPAGHPLVRLARSCLDRQGIPAHLGIGSTDANVPLSLGLPAVCIGLTTGGGAHTMDEFVRISPLSRGMEQLAALVEGAFRELPAL